MEKLPLQVHFAISPSVVTGVMCLDSGLHHVYTEFIMFAVWAYSFYATTRTFNDKNNFSTGFDG